MICLNNGKRSLIIAVDNRAKEISKDTNLPVIGREEVKEKLESMINNTWRMEINLPVENIRRWKAQFMSESVENNGGYSLKLFFITNGLFEVREVCA